VATKLLEVHPNPVHEKNDDFKTPLDPAMEHGRCSEDVVRLFAISDMRRVLLNSSVGRKQRSRKGNDKHAKGRLLESMPSGGVELWR
jgi:hypothetical protein